MSYRIILTGLFFILCIGFNTLRLFKYDLHPSSYRDFINPYVGTSLWFENKNPYSDVFLKEKWEEIKKEEKLNASFNIGIPENPFVYPVVTVPLFSWTHYFTYIQSLYIWLVICFIGFTVIYIYALKLMEHYGITSFTDKLWFTGIFLSIKFLYPSFFLGQPSIVAFAFAIAGYYHYVKNKEILSGVLFGLASIKITILFPFIILLLIDKKWKILATSFYFMFLLSMAFFIKDITVSSILTEYSKNINELHRAIYHIKEGNHITDLMTKSTELTTITTYFFRNSLPYIALIKILYTLSVIILIKPVLKYLREEKIILWMIVSIWSLLIVYHLMYDLIILLPIYIVYKKYPMNKVEKLSFILFLLLLIIPVNTIIDKIPSPGFFVSAAYIHIPIALLGMQYISISVMKKKIHNRPIACEQKFSAT